MSSEHSTKSGARKSGDSLIEHLLQPGEDPRAFLAEVFWNIGNHAEIGERAAVAGDLTIAEIAVNRIVTYLQQARFSLNDMRQEVDAWNAGGRP